MRQLKDIYPDYADRVDFLAVDVDSNEDAGKIAGYKLSEGFVWPMTTVDRDMLEDYRVTRQATFATIGADGLIVSSISSGSMSDSGWREIFQGLIDS